MRDPEAVDILLEIYRLESASFARYVVEVSRPPVVDDVDQKALAVIQDIYRDISRNAQAVGQLLLDEGTPPLPEPRWPLQYTNFNYLRPRYLLRPLHERLRAQLAAVESRAAELAGFDWREAKDVVETVLRRERACVERLAKVVEETPEESASRPALKGTSASRW